jgi:hypothetical protein
VFVAQSGGTRAAADVAPATRDAYIAALIDGRRTFWLTTQAGRPHKLISRMLASPAPVFDSQGVQEAPRAPHGAATATRQTYVEHGGCGSNARNAVALDYTEAEAPKASAHATPGAPWAGRPQPDAHGLRVESIPRSPAAPATRHHSEAAYAKCGICDRYMKPGDIYWGIQHGVTWIYAEHEECP